MGGQKKCIMRQPQITDKHQPTNIKFLIIFLTNKIVPFCYLSMLIFWAIWRCLYGSFELSLEIPPRFAGMNWKTFRGSKSHQHLSGVGYSSTHNSCRSFRLSFWKVSKSKKKTESLCFKKRRVTSIQKEQSKLLVGGGFKYFFIFIF